MPASSTDESPSILDSMLMAAKKLPGQTVGGGIDLMNMVLGGGANIVQAIQGKEITRSIGEGLVPKPVGGSEQLNDLFGIPNTSSGLVEDSTGAILNALNPAGAVKSAVVGGKAMIVAAATMTEPAVLAKAKRAIEQGTDAAQVFKYTGVYEGPIDKKLRAVLDDSTSMINPDAVKRITPLGNAPPYRVEGPPKPIVAPLDTPTALDEILGHPKLFELYPELKEVTVVRGDQGPNSAAAYNGPAGSRIEMGPATSMEEFHSVLLHEVQHVVQHLEGFSSGASPQAFLPSSKFYDSFKNVQTAARELTSKLAKKFGLMPEEIQQMAQNPAARNSGIFSDPDFQLYLKTRKAQAVGMEVEKKATAQYMQVAGEAEARAVQNQFKMRELGDKIYYPPHLYDDASFPIIPSPYDSKLKAKP